MEAPVPSTQPSGVADKLQEAESPAEVKQGRKKVSAYLKPKGLSLPRLDPAAPRREQDETETLSDASFPASGCFSHSFAQIRPKTFNQMCEGKKPNKTKQKYSPSCTWEGQAFAIRHPEGAGPWRGTVSPGAFSLVIISWQKSQVWERP